MGTLFKVLITITIATLLVLPPASAASLGPTSEEKPPASCNPGSLVTGVLCTGRYCDNIAISCDGPGRFHQRRANNIIWTSWRSEENGGWNRCPAGHYISGFACRGRYCDKLSLSCVRLDRVSAFNCANSSRVSEENGGRLNFFSGINFDTAGQKLGARAMKCSGSYCDNKRFEVCELSAN